MWVPGSIAYLVPLFGSAIRFLYGDRPITPCERRICCRQQAAPNRAHTFADTR